MAAPLAKIGIISIGDMGVGIAKLLVANGFSVATNANGRSNDTLERAKSAQVELLDSDEALVRQCAVILSVVPPRDAVATAQRIADALSISGRDNDDNNNNNNTPLYFADLNAVSPSTVKRIAALFDSREDGLPAPVPAPVRFVDGSILGGPPKPKPVDAGADATGSSTQWSLPHIPTSGPHQLSAIPVFGPRLAATLNARHISGAIGAASGLKMCFGGLSKGLTAIAVQSFATAARLGVLGELRAELGAVLPRHLELAERGVVGMAPKAYRWAGEMEEVACTLAEEGGFDPDTFVGAAKTYRLVADDTVLGREKVGKRVRGTTVEDVADAVAEGLRTKRKKND
ncbi:6-phosphogluconate dehydrogenase C-terminal domain-like protein [Daldinia caldariorum]|uniref:6-phosphogluconate dehydrogenase C-terminal domain-like protein n=1 Tax=Daldinia caldariorum TaxID=326644 RepID=UPI0020071F3E|nr:6-phosphogluconate dehydrogenase C-terminal domain-like protein [Daldinia caldariorum]KAI1470262.1 6-phosphogluconate dehydrogenase C-terminal domain-like protein [Daldinia caldariorum]